MELGTPEKPPRMTPALQEAVQQFTSDSRSESGETRELNATHARLDRQLAPERPLDQLVTDDQEILGQSTHLRREMNQVTHDTVDTLDKRISHLRDNNPVTSARNEYLAFRRDRIALKVERLERKVAASPDTRWNKHRKNTLEMFKKRQKWREKQMDTRSQKQVKRGEKADKREEKRDEKFQAQVDKYINRKVEAMRRKERRELFRSHDIGPLNVRERTRFLAALPKETKKRITREAILAVREQNIKKGDLEWDYTVDETRTKRSLQDYERTTK